MIHVIPQHISRGSYTPWYKLLNIKDGHIFHSFDDTAEIERKLIGEPPYIDKLIENQYKYALILVWSTLIRHVSSEYD